MVEKQTPDPNIPETPQEGWREIDGDVLVPDISDGFGGNESIDAHYAFSISPSSGNTAPSQPTSLEKMLIVHGAAGFHPTNSRELSEALALLDGLGTPFSTSGHLNEVLLHQRKSSSENPELALKSILGDYINFAKRARMDFANLIFFKEELDQIKEGTLKISGHVHTGLGQFVRSLDIRILLDNPEESFLKGVYVPPTNNRSFDPYISDRPEKNLAEHIANVIDDKDLEFSRKMTDIFITEQKARFQFWIDRIKEAKNHLAVRGMASTALKDLGIES